MERLHDVPVEVAVVGDAQVSVCVCDQGGGLDPARVPPGRPGIAGSTQGRMARHRGSATITSEPGEVTEVLLRLPLERP